MLSDVVKHGDRADKVHDRESPSEPTWNVSLSQNTIDLRGFSKGRFTRGYIGLYLYSARSEGGGPTPSGMFNSLTPLLLPLGTADRWERVITLPPRLCHAM